MPFISHDNDPRYQGWVENVRSLKKAKINIGRLINRQIKASKISASGSIGKNDLEVISNLSKSAFLIYSSYTEANLLRLIHLPNSFSETEVKKILAIKEHRSIIDAWLEAIQISSKKNNVSIDGGFSIIACETRLKQIVNSCLKDPSILRNKIIHGQWFVAYNKSYSGQNLNLSHELNNIDIAKIDGWFLIFDELAELLRQLIQSPNKGFPVQYNGIIDRIDNLSVKVATWNIMTKKNQLSKTGRIPLNDN